MGGSWGALGLQVPRPGLEPGPPRGGDFKSESGHFRNLSDGTGFGRIPYPQRIWKPYEVYEDYEVFCPLRDSSGTALGDAIV